MSYHFTYQMAKGKPTSLLTEASIQHHVCSCQMEPMCKCTCHHTSPHLSPNQSYTKTNINIQESAELNHHTIDKETDCDYYQKIRRDRSTKNIKSQVDDEAMNSHSLQAKHRSPASHSLKTIFKQKEDNKKIQLDLETFNQELLALKRKLENEKKDTPKRYEMHNRQLSLNASGVRLVKEAFCFSLYGSLERRRLVDDNMNLSKDLVIEELKFKLFEANELIKAFKRLEEEKEVKLSQQAAEMDKLRKDNAQLKHQAKKSQMNSRQFNTAYIVPIACDEVLYLNPNSYKTTQRNYKESEVIKTKLIRFGDSSSSRLLKRTQTSQKSYQSKTLNYSNNNKVILSKSLVFRVYDKKSILYFDIESKQFYLYHFADYSHFNEDYVKDASLYLTHNSVLYIITGVNSDLLYAYNPKGWKMTKLSQLLNNHVKGAIVALMPNDSQEESLICIGSAFNKKAERYSIKRNVWTELPELNEERAECSCVVINSCLLYVIFGFNSILNKPIEVIEYLDLSKEASSSLFSWNYVELVNKHNVRCGIKGSLAINYNNKKIILIGGFEGAEQKPIENFHQLLLNAENEEEMSLERVDRKLNEISKNKAYCFSSGFTFYEDDKRRQYNLAFDNKGVLHMFEVSKMMHDVFYSE